MQNQKLTAILRQAVKENETELRHEKICLIEDIMKAKKLLYGMGQIQHNEFLHPIAHAKKFDELYEFNLDQLKLVRDGYTAKINELAKAQIKQY
jgi:hypothetical protein